MGQSAIISENIRTNQTFFKTIDAITHVPWLTNDGLLYLLFDYVHYTKLYSQ